MYAKYLAIRAQLLKPMSTSAIVIAIMVIGVLAAGIISMTTLFAPVTATAATPTPTPTPTSSATQAPTPHFAFDNASTEASLVETNVSWQQQPQTFDKVGQQPRYVYLQCTGWFYTENVLFTAGHCGDDPDFGIERLEGGGNSYGLKDYSDTNAPVAPEPMQSSTIDDPSSPDTWGTLQFQAQAKQSQTVTDSPLTQWTTLQHLATRTWQDGDMSLFKISGMVGARHLTLSDTPATVGDTVTIVGYDYHAMSMGDQSDTSAGSFDWRNDTAITLTSSVVAMRERHGVQYLYLQGAVADGMSGSPVLDFDGNVVGMISGIDPNNPQYTLAIGVDDIKQFAAANGIDPNKNTGDPSVTSSASDVEPLSDIPASATSSNWHWRWATFALFMIALALGLIALAIFLAARTIVEHFQNDREYLLHRVTVVTRAVAGSLSNIADAINNFAATADQHSNDYVEHDITTGDDTELRRQTVDYQDAPAPSNDRPVEHQDATGIQNADGSRSGY